MMSRSHLHETPASQVEEIYYFPVSIVEFQMIFYIYLNKCSWHFLYWFCYCNNVVFLSGYLTYFGGGPGCILFGWCSMFWFLGLSVGRFFWCRSSNNLPRSSHQNDSIATSKEKNILYNMIYISKLAYCSTSHQTVPIFTQSTLHWSYPDDADVSNNVAWQNVTMLYSSK